ncbi:MAG: alpha/beta fold hydrolase [Solirubrobacteraceae bacterium]
MPPDRPAPGAEITRAEVRTETLEFATLQAGSGSAPLALCLHGFPDTAHTWRHLLPALAQAGYHAVAPWLRGYEPTGVPADGIVSLAALSTDVIALHEALGADGDAVLIGHDWGAAMAYAAASWQPQRWRRLVTMSIPPPSVTGPMFADYGQLKRFFYVFVFQQPEIEALVAAGELDFLTRLWADWSPGYDPAADLKELRRSLPAMINVSAAIAPYRALLQPDRTDLEGRYEAGQRFVNCTPEHPTLYLHGDQDGCVGPEALGDVGGHLPAGSRYELLRGAGHFLHLERPVEVNQLTLEWLAG